MTKQTTKPKDKDLAQEEQRMDQEIERLEAEALELETPGRALMWDEIQAGAVENLEKRERRRGILPRLIAAAKIKRAEIRRERHEQELEPLYKSREEAHEKLEAATTKRFEAIDAENMARGHYSDAHVRILGRERRIKEINQEIRELQGEQPTNSSSPYEWTRQA